LQEVDVSGPGFGWRPLHTPEVDRARRVTALERRERFAARHPEITIATRRDGGRLLFEVSEPSRPARAIHDANAMMDDLEDRYPEMEDARNE
jgi:hypothetical protein